MTVWLWPVAIVVWVSGSRKPWHLIVCLLGSFLGPPALLAAALPLPVLRGAQRLRNRILSAADGDSVRRSIPILLTDLGMAAEAGQPLHTALRDAAEYGDGPLASALIRFGDRLDEGASVASALESLRRDLQTPQTDRLIGLLSRDAQLGLPLAASVARYRRNWLSEARRDASRTIAYLPYVFTALAGLLLLEGVALLAVPWLASLWRSF
jgi:Flp pilus assembly protein TadB